MNIFGNLGQALRWLRNRCGRRQMDVAQAAGITKAMLSAYETGKQLPTIPTLDRILTALGADLQELREALLLHQGSRLPPFDDRGPTGNR